VIGEGIGQIVVIGKFRDKLIILSEDAFATAFEFWILDCRVEEIAGSIPKPIRQVEAAVKGAMWFAASIVPFPADASLVASEFHGLAQRDHLIIEELNPSPTLSWVETGEQGGSSGGAFRIVVELPETQAVGGHFIKIRCLNDLGSIGPDVGPAHIVHHN